MGFPGAINEDHDENVKETSFSHDTHKGEESKDEQEDTQSENIVRLPQEVKSDSSRISREQPAIFR